jgi:hypothetical protein
VNLPAPRPAPTGPIAVPPSSAAIPIDGEWEPDWNDRAVRVIFHVTGGTDEARPYSELRLMRDGDALLVGLYAADEDIHSTEAFALSIGALAVHVDATGAVTPPVPGAKSAIDLDGTRDVPGDYDEEWKIELSIPIAALGAKPGATIPIHADRCDTPKDGIQRCGAWDGALAPRETWPAK